MKKIAFIDGGTERVVFDDGEKDPFGKDAHGAGSKLDAGKSPIWQGLFTYFPRALKAVSDVSDFGAKKYSWGGWFTVPDALNRYTNALGRHLLDEAKGEMYAPDSGLLHAAHAAWNALARLEKVLVEQEVQVKREAEAK